MAAHKPGDDDTARVYYCPRCHARNRAYGDVPPACAACGLPLGLDDTAPPPDTRGRTSWVLSLGVIVMLGLIVWQQRGGFGDPGLGLGAVMGLDGTSATDLALARSEAIQLCAAEARARLGQAFDDAPFADGDVRREADGSYRIDARPAGADSLYGLTHAGFTCRVQRVEASHGSWEITEFAVQGDGPAP